MLLLQLLQLQCGCAAHYVEYFALSLAQHGRNAVATVHAKGGVVLLKYIPCIMRDGWLLLRNVLAFTILCVLAYIYYIYTS